MATDNAEVDRTVVYLGNRNAIQVLPDPDDDGATIRSTIDGPAKNCTTIVLGESAPGVPLTLMEAAQQITDPHRGIWSWHSDDAAPAWVAASGPLGPVLAALLGAHWGVEVREPDPAHGSEG